MTQEQAIKILKTGSNVFLTGEPGSGKTYTVNKYISYLRSHGIEPAITASTGIAATHIGGMTIHSWSGIGIKSKLSKGDLRGIAESDYIQKRISRAKVLIIDEISMLPAESLQSIEAICREVKKDTRPFGGLQVVLVGDFFQLPPVVKKIWDENSQVDLFDEPDTVFAYGAEAWQRADLTTCYITEQYRQSDELLLQILSKIRRNSFDQESLGHLATRKVAIIDLHTDIPKLYSHNIDVDSVNNQMLAKLPGEAKLYRMKAKGRPHLIEAMKKGCLSPENLYLKIGAVVMFTKNNPKEKYVNGTLGEVVAFSQETGLPIIATKDGERIEADYAEWSVEEDGKVKGQLAQLPLRLAWALTVHKSQGVSLDEAIIDLSKVFEYGQGYVALSRVRNLNGLHLLGWNETAFKVSEEILEKDNDFRQASYKAERQFSNLPDSELQKANEDFITLCDGSIGEIERKEKPGPKVSTYDETLKLWQEGMDVAQIAKARKLNSGTILNHLEKLVLEDKIGRDDISRTVPQNLLPVLPEISEVFKKFDTTKLSDVFKHFKGKYSYEELKWARMTLKHK